VKITLLDGIPPETVKKNLPSFVPVSLHQEPEAVILRSSLELQVELEKTGVLPSSLRAICRAGSGTENIPVEWCSAHGIPVFNTPGANANAVKEMVLCSLFLSSRNVIPAYEFVKGHMGIPSIDWEKEKKKFRGEEISGKNILIIGLGKVGSLVAKSVKDFGMNVYGYDPYRKGDVLGVDVLFYSLEDTLIEECDFITLHPSLTDETRGFIDKYFLSRTKRGVKIINFARKEMVDADALHKVLKNGHARMYICDAVDDRLYLSPDKILLFPHIGAETKEAQDAGIRMATEQLKNFWSLGLIKNSINFPTMEWVDLLPSHSYGVRFAICNMNVPGAVASCANVLTRHSLNIVSFVNKSRGNVGYNIFDVEISGERRESLQKILEEMKENKAITQARVIVSRT